VILKRIRLAKDRLPDFPSTFGLGLFFNKPVSNGISLDRKTEKQPSFIFYLPNNWWSSEVQHKVGSILLLMSSPTDSTASDAFRTYGVELRMSPACRECLSEDNIGISQGLLHIKPVYDLLEIKAIFDLPHKSIDLSSRGFHFIFPMVLFEIHPDPSTVEESIQTSFQPRSKMRRKDCTVTERLQQKR
jgi:hypothetical protein